MARLGRGQPFRPKVASPIVGSLERFVASGTTGHLTASWTIPTVNADGTPLGDLAGIYLDYGTSPGSYSTTLTLGVVTSYLLTNLIPGTTYYVSVRAFDTADPPNISVPSPEVSGVAGADVGMVRFESRGLLTVSRTVTTESKGLPAGAVSQSAVVRIESQRLISATAQDRIESLTGVTQPRVARHESRGLVASASIVQVSPRQFIAQARGSVIETLTSQTVSRSIPVSPMGFAIVQNTAVLRFESLGLPVITMGRTVRFESRAFAASVSADRVVSLSPRGGLFIPVPVRLSLPQALTVSRIAHLARKSSVSSARQLLFETRGFLAVQANRTLYFEARVGPLVYSPVKILVLPERDYVLAMPPRGYQLLLPPRIYRLILAPEGEFVALSIDKQPSEIFSYELDFSQKLPLGRTLQSGTLFASRTTPTNSTTIAVQASADANTLILANNPGVGALLTINPLLSTQEKVKVSAVTASGGNSSCTIVPAIAYTHLINETVNYEVGVSAQILVGTVAQVESVNRKSVLPRVTRGVSGQTFRVTAIMILDNLDQLEGENLLLVEDV